MLYICTLIIKNVIMKYFLLIILLIAWYKFRPNLDWLEQEKMLLLHYNTGYTRKYLVIFKL